MSTTPIILLMDADSELSGPLAKTLRRLCPVFTVDTATTYESELGDAPVGMIISGAAGLSEARAIEAILTERGEPRPLLVLLEPSLQRKGLQGPVMKAYLCFSGALAALELDQILHG